MYFIIIILLYLKLIGNGVYEKNYMAVYNMDQKQKCLIKSILDEYTYNRRQILVYDSNHIHGPWVCDVPAPAATYKNQFVCKAALKAIV